MTKQDPLAIQLETLFSDIVVPAPDVHRRRPTARVVEVALAPPEPLRFPQPAVPRQRRVSERWTGPQWVLVTPAALALVILLGVFLIGPGVLEAQKRDMPAELPVQGTGAPMGIESAGLVPAVSGDIRTDLTGVTPSAAEKASPTPVRVVATPLTRPMTLTISVAGQPGSTQPVPAQVSDATSTDTPTVPASPTNTNPPPTADGSSSTPPADEVRETGTPEITLAARPTVTATIAPAPTATNVQADPPTPTILPSPTPILVEQAPPAPTWTPTTAAPAPQPAPSAPDRLLIPAISLEAPIITVGYVNYTINGQPATTFAVPDHFAVGWHHTSAPPGYPGNTVLNGHQMINGGVFRDLEALGYDDEIIVYSGDAAHHYRVSEQHLLAEEGQPLSVRVENARWIMPTGDERLTLVTCAPYGKSSHRLVIVARPSGPRP